MRSGEVVSVAGEKDQGSRGSTTVAVRRVEGASEPASAPEHRQETATAPWAPQRLSDEEFEKLVDKALDKIPPELMEAVENCAFIVEAEPPPGRPRLLGLYHGRPLTSRGDYGGAMPDTITIYQGPLQRLFRDPERLEHEVYRTVVHEIGHYFGFEEHELHELGWG